MPALATWGRAGLADLQSFLAAADAATTRPGDRDAVGQALRADRRHGLSSDAWARPALHLALHTAHHRGQVNARLRELGAEPPLVDYIAWLWKGRPDAMWPRNVAPPGTATT